MLTLGTYEVKTHLPRLLAQVEKGEIITVTRHGKPIAKLVPIGVDRAKRGNAAGRLVAEFRKLRRGIKRRGPSAREMIQEGRRF
jgi:prevent-host-death family protein